jgi:glyoxylase-like metal-dependent hydrolase (beta-lactamase superfamily II)
LTAWRTDRVSHLVYTHGHADHIGGSSAFAAAAEWAGVERPRVVGHANVAARIDRYALTDGWNRLINARQFGGVAGDLRLTIGEDEDDGTQSSTGFGRRFLPRGTLRPDETFEDYHELTVGDHVIELHHARGETDDHLWAWFPERRWIMAGDFLIWNFPNAGNPQKVQRYPIEWAAALRRMAAEGPELFVPAHGLPIGGRERIARVLDDVATALEDLVRDVLEMMNAGATLDTIVHTVKVPQETLAKPYLRPLYDEPEFVVRGVWRQFGGWWDGAASRLKPSPDAELAAAIADLAGGADVLIRRSEQAVADGDLRLACHFADLAGWAAPDDPTIHGARAAVYEVRRKAETSLMAKGYPRPSVTNTSARTARPSPIVCERLTRSPSNAKARPTVLAGYSELTTATSESNPLRTASRYATFAVMSNTPATTAMPSDRRWSTGRARVTRTSTNSIGIEIDRAATSGHRPASSAVRSRATNSRPKPTPATTAIPSTGRGVRPSWCPAAPLISATAATASTMPR